MTGEGSINELVAKRTPCEVYSRVVGYVRPINQWNDGKRSEYGDRVTFDLSPEC
jgi:ribonucleoside-triphosphate reductase